jgi:hypothetical protein
MRHGHGPPGSITTAPGAARTRRVLNRGLAIASLAGVLSLAWLLGSFVAARSSLVRRASRGTRPG